MALDFGHISLLHKKYKEKNDEYGKVNYKVTGSR